MSGSDQGGHLPAQSQSTLLAATTANPVAVCSECTSPAVVVCLALSTQPCNRSIPAGTEQSPATDRPSNSG